MATTVGGGRQVLGKQAVHEGDSSTFLNWTQDQHRPTSMSEIPSAPQVVCHMHTLPPSGNGTLPHTGLEVWFRIYNVEAGGGQKGQKQRSMQQKDTGRAVGLPWLSSQGTEPRQPCPCWSRRKHQSLNDILGAHQGTLFPRRIQQIGGGPAALLTLWGELNCYA